MVRAVLLFGVLAGCMAGCSCIESPIARDDQASTYQDTPVRVDVLDNDEAGDGTWLTINWVGDPAAGWCFPGDNGCVVYTPEPDFVGTDTFVYEVYNDSGRTARATVRISVRPLDDDPPAEGITANDDAFTVDAGARAQLDVLANDSDAAGLDLSIISVSAPQNGSAGHTAGLVWYEPAADFVGRDTLTYTVGNGTGATAEATVSLDVISNVNLPPVAVDDMAQTHGAVAVEIDAPANDSDPEGGALTITGVTQPSEGVVEILDGMLKFTPNAGVEGLVVFEYTISDDQGLTDTAWVSVNVLPPNTAPVAEGDYAQTWPDTAVEIDVLANDSDADGDALLLTAPGEAAHGSVTITEDNTLLYMPDAGFEGDDSFTYTMSDGLDEAQATVSVHVSYIWNNAPVAEDDAVATDDRTPVLINVVANDVDPDGDALSVVEITLPARYGTLEIVSDTEVLYTPTEGYVGDDDFIYRVSDGSLSDAAVAVIHIAEANDDPVAENDEATTLPSAAVTVDVLANDSDPNGDPLQVSDVSQPSNGTAELIDGQITYTPDEGFAGVDTFWYAVVDGRGGSAVAYVDVTVNTPPVAEDDRSGAVPEETTLLHVLGNDWDPDGDALTVVECSSMQGCDVTLNADSTIAFTPLPGFHGIDEISYTVADIYGATDTAVVEVRVNTPPLAVDDNVLTAQDVPLLISVLDNDGDADGDVLSVVGTTAPANGEAVLEGNTVVYRPNAGFWGSDSFTYTVDDSWGGTATATVTVTVNAPPAADADATTVHAGHEVLIDVLTNDSDPEGGALTLHAVGLPLIGEAQIDGGEIRYTAPVGQTGEDTFSYTIRDEHGAEATGTVTVTILPNDPPTTADDSGTTAVDTPLALDVLANDSDPEGGSLTVLAVTSADHGNVTIEADGTLTYTPVGGFVGEDSFSYQVADDVGQVAWATVTITVE